MPIAMTDHQVLTLIVNGTNNVKTFNRECLISSYVKTVHLYLIVRLNGLMLYGGCYASLNISD